VFIVIQGQRDRRGGDTTILDSVAGHRRTFDALAALLAGPNPSVEIAAAGRCHLCPDWDTLRLLRVVKANDKVRTEELPDGVLQVSGRPDLLARYIDAFRFEPGHDGDHRHPEQELASRGELAAGSRRIIVQADEDAVPQ
jgi:hypothetical protein